MAGWLDAIDVLFVSSYGLQKAWEPTECKGPPGCLIAHEETELRGTVLENGGAETDGHILEWLQIHTAFITEFLIWIS